MKHILILILAVIALLSSCSEYLQTDPSITNRADVEIINGFEVSWGNLSQRQKIAVKRIINNMVLVEGGIFLMGATEFDYEYAMEIEFPAHYVSLTDYYICKYELTYDDYVDILSDFSLNSCYAPSITWHWYSSRNDWELIIDILRATTGLPFDFPTEAQWEYAARGGVKSRGYIYAGSNNHGDVWCNLKEPKGTSMPNELGLYNMSDGVSEWCKDRFKQYSSHILEEDPCNVYGSEYVVRGGNYESCHNTNFYNVSYSFRSIDRDYRICRCSARMPADGGDVKYNNIGLRLTINI